MDLGTDNGPEGRQVQFLRDFGPALIEKYRPKAILVFSAHWETDGERLVSDWGAENPNLYDYFGARCEGRIVERAYQWQAFRRSFTPKSASEARATMLCRGELWRLSRRCAQKTWPKPFV
jgi:hypothetical protein